MNPSRRLSGQSPDSAPSAAGHRGLRTAAAAAVLAIALPNALHAHQAVVSEGFDARTMTPGPGRSTSFWWQSYASTAGHLRRDDAVFLNYARIPLVLTDEAGSATNSVISDQLTLHLPGLPGLSNHFDIGIDIPMILLPQGDSLAEPAGTQTEGSSGIGDIRFQLRTSFLRMREQGEAGPALGLMADVQLPTGNAEQYQGEAIRVEPRLALDWVFAKTSRIGVAADYMFRSDTTFGPVQIYGHVSVSAASAIAQGSRNRVWLVPEIRSPLRIAAADGITEQNSPTEALFVITQQTIVCEE